MWDAGKKTRGMGILCQRPRHRCQQTHDPSVFLEWLCVPKLQLVLDSSGGRNGCWGVFSRLKGVLDSLLGWGFCSITAFIGWMVFTTSMVLCWVDLDPSGPPNPHAFAFRWAEVPKVGAAMRVTTRTRSGCSPPPS